MMHPETAKHSAAIVTFVGVLVALLGLLAALETEFVQPRIAVGPVALIWAGLVTAVAGRNILVSRTWISHPRWFLTGCFWGLISVRGTCRSLSVSVCGCMGCADRNDTVACARLEARTSCSTRQPVSAVAGHVCVDDAGGEPADAVLADNAWSWFRFRGIRQHTAHQTCTRAGRLRLGLARLRGRLRWFDDLIWILGGSRIVYAVSGNPVCRFLAPTRLVYTAGLSGRFCSVSRNFRLASGRRMMHLYPGHHEGAGAF